MCHHFFGFQLFYCCCWVRKNQNYTRDVEYHALPFYSTNDLVTFYVCVRVVYLIEYNLPINHQWYSYPISYIYFCQEYDMITNKILKHFSYLWWVIATSHIFIFNIDMCAIKIFVVIKKRSTVFFNLIYDLSLFML